jgi:hypothetical protein
MCQRGYGDLVTGIALLGRDFDLLVSPAMLVCQRERVAAADKSWDGAGARASAWMHDMGR